MSFWLTQHYPPCDPVGIWITRPHANKKDAMQKGDLVFFYETKSCPKEAGSSTVQKGRGSVVGLATVTHVVEKLKFYTVHYENGTKDWAQCAVTKPVNTDSIVSRSQLNKILRYKPNHKLFGLNIRQLTYLEAKRLAEAMSGNDGSLLVNKAAVQLDDDEQAFPEGSIKYRLHKERERDRKLIELVKAEHLESGDLHCEVCNFSFSNQYGELGTGFIEAHHNFPVSKMKKGHKTRKEDIALVCSNCHRMLHRSDPWLSVRQLKMRMHKK